MNPAALLSTLRSRGFTLHDGPSGLYVTGPEPKDPEKAKAMLVEHEAGLRKILEAEGIMGGVLKR